MRKRHPHVDRTRPRGQRGRSTVASGDTSAASQTTGLRIAELGDSTGASVPLHAVRTGEWHFGFALSRVQGRQVYVHVVGSMDHRAAEAVAAGFAPLLARASSGGRAARRPHSSVVLLDLSGLYFVDDTGLSSLHRAVVGLTSYGWHIQQNPPHGPSLRLLDSAARAGWVPPKLTCVDVLHWHPYAAGRDETDQSCPCG